MQIKKIESEGEVYQRLKLLGQGAFGKAYLVKQRATSNLCVIKQINIAQMSQTQQNQTFKEAKILQALNHPNIVKFKEVYVTTNKKLNIVMEYADGGDLSKKIKEQKATGKLFDESIILDWFTQLCLAIKHVHDRKIIHRDIKGQNIFITKNNTVKLGDFGIARVLNKTMEKAKTVVGTPYYLSPEIIQSKPYSYKTDIWSMGVVLYQLCMLAPPFNAGSLQYLALKIVKGNYTPITGTYSKQIKNLIADMLHLDSNKRPSADQILKLPFIIKRIQKFLTETQNKVEFSHTVLHDFKLGFNKDKQIMQNIRGNSKDNKKELDAKQAEKQRLMLKERQAQMQKLRQQKRKQDKINEQKRRRKQDEQRAREAEDRKREAEDRKKQQVRKFQQKQQQYRQQQARIQYERYEKYRANEQKNRLNQQKRREIEDKAKKDKQQQDKKYLQFAKQQFFRNKAIKQNAERRAASENNFMSNQPYQYKQQQPKQPANLPKPNFHYKKDSQAIQIKVNQRPQSREKQRAQVQSQNYWEMNKPNNKEPIRPPSRQKPRQRNPQPQINQQMLMNAYMNPNFQKKQQSKQITPPQTEQKKKIIKQPSKKQQKKPQSKVKSNLRSVIQEGRKQMRQDKYKSKQQQHSTDISYQQQQDLPHFKQSPKKQEPQSNYNSNDQFIQNQNKQKIKTIRGSKWNKNEEPKTPQKDQQIQQILEQNKLLQDMIDKQIQQEQQSAQELDDLILQLKKIVGNVVEQVQQLPSIHVGMMDNQRKDDWVEPQKDSQFEQKTIYQKQNLKYFSDYSKLEELRMSLEDVFGTDTFVKLYRIVEKQFQSNGIQGLEHQKLRQKVPFINQNLFSQYITMLVTLIVIENKIDEQQTSN